MYQSEVASTMWSLPNSSYNNPWAGDGGAGQDGPGRDGGGPPAWNPFHRPQGHGPTPPLYDESGRAGGPPHGENRRANGASALEEPPRVFPELQEMTSSELEVLIHDQHTFDQLVANHAYKKRMVDEIHALRAEIEELRKTNEQKLNEGSLTDLQSRLAESQKIEAELRKEVAEKEDKREQYLEKNSPEAMYHRLSQAVQEAEDSSMKLKSDFLNGDIDYATFSKAYIADRKLYHARTAKSHSLMELLT